MKTKKAILILGLALIIAVGIEVYNLRAMSLWHDEAFSALLLQYNFKEMIYRISLDVHPPFYYILLRGWNFFFGSQTPTSQLFSLRFFSLFFGVLAVLSTYWLVKEALKNKKLALLASVWLAFNSFQIQYAMEARMFALGTFLIIISSFFLLKALRSKSLHWWFFYVLTASAGIYTHYYIFFSLLAQGFFVAYYLFKESKFNFSAWLKNQNFQFGLGAYFLIFLSYLPWLKTFLSQASQVQESFWIPPMNIWSVPATFLKMTTGGTIDAFRFWYVLTTLMIAIVVALIFALKKLATSAKWLIFLLLIVPFLGATIVSLRAAIYLDRYFIFTLPFYLILISGAILAIKNQWLKKTLIGVIILASLVSFPIRWANLDVERKPGMRAAAAYLNQEVKPEDKIYVGSSFVYFTFKFYNRTGIHPRLYVPGPLAHFSGTALLSSEDMIKDFSKEVKKSDVIWLINTTGFGNYQPQVPKNWVKLEEEKFQDVYDYRGWIMVSQYQVN